MKRHSFIITFVASMGMAGLLWASDAIPFTDFTFKRVKVPSQGGAKRITVQIDPSAIVVAPKPVTAQPEPDTPEVDDALAEGQYAWYWNEISPQMIEASSGRLENAVAKLSAGPYGQTVAAPRLQHLQQIASIHGGDILAATIGTKVSPALVLAVIGMTLRSQI